MLAVSRKRSSGDERVAREVECGDDELVAVLHAALRDFILGCQSCDMGTLIPYSIRKNCSAVSPVAGDDL